MLWLARFDSRPAPPGDEPVDLATLAQACADRFRAVGPAITVETPARADADQRAAGMDRPAGRGADGQRSAAMPARRAWSGSVSEPTAAVSASPSKIAAPELSRPNGRGCSTGFTARPSRDRARASGWPGPPPGSRSPPPRHPGRDGLPAERVDHAVQGGDGRIAYRTGSAATLVKNLSGRSERLPRWLRRPMLRAMPLRWIGWTRRRSWPRPTPDSRSS